MKSLSGNLATLPRYDTISDVKRANESNSKRLDFFLIPLAHEEAHLVVSTKD